MNIQNDSLEKALLIPMSKADVTQMTPDLTELFLRFFLISQNEEDKTKVYTDLLEKSWTLRAVEKRIEASLTIEVDKAVQCFLICLTNGNIGQCVMYLYYFQYWAKLNNVACIDFDVFSRIFPHGYPSESTMQLLWELQKIDGGNMIDIAMASESIQLQTVS